MSDHEEQVRLLFDSKAAGWPAKYTPRGRLAGRLARLSDAVGSLVVPGGDLLDLGCGSGDVARHLEAAGYLVTGCDIAPEMLRRAREFDASDVRWVMLDERWCTLPFGAGLFDAVIVSSVLEYVPDPAVVLGECARVLRPGGTVLCTVPDMTHPVRWLEWPLRLAARSPLAAAMAMSERADGVPHRITQHMTYLRTSRQRRRVAWWYTTARHAGLECMPATRAPRDPLRLLIFRLPAGPGGRQSMALEER